MLLNREPKMSPDTSDATVTRATDEHLQESWAGDSLHREHAEIVEFDGVRQAEHAWHVQSIRLVVIRPVQDVAQPELGKQGRGA